MSRSTIAATVSGDVKLASNHYKSGAGTPEAGMTTGFHTYGVDWEPDTITFYFDGQPMGAKIMKAMPDRMYILLDLWFGSASGNPDNTTPTGKGNSYEVNYVRAWKLK